jgi:hypothetical protein
MSGSDTEDPRRRILLLGLTGGFFAAGVPTLMANADVLGKKPGPLPPGRSIYDLIGEVKVNGVRATAETRIGANDTVETGANSLIIFVVGKDSFMMRSNSKMVLKGERDVLSSISLAAGKLLSVFGKSKHQLRTPTATIGIRGTGVYAEADPEETYLCTCYGVVDVASMSDKTSKETVSTKHHERPLYIAAKQQPGKAIRSAPMKNHTDSELMLIEAIVGRTPPFTFSADDYNSMRRDY